MEKRLSLVILAALCRLSAAQYGSSSSSYSYSSPSSSSMSASPASSVSYPSVNLPLLSIPVTVGNATYTPSGLVSVVTNTTTTNTSSTNFLATLPSSAIYNYAAPKYQYGVYANDYDASRDYYYNHSNFYPLNVYVNAVQGIGGALNLSDPVAVAAASWWAPYPYRLTSWGDNTTTTNTTTNTTTSATTASSVSTVTVPNLSGLTVLNSSVFYAAYGGSINGLGQAGIGLSVPGPGPSNVVSPGLNVAYAVQSTPTGSMTPTGTTGTTGTMTGTSYSYGSSPSPSPSPSSSYGRRRREAAPLFL